MSSVSTESQYGLRHINGVPVWNGDILTLRDYETAALWFRAGLKPGEQERAVARLWANLQGPAKEVVRMCKPQDFEDARGVERLLRILRESPLASMPVPDAYKKIQAYDQIRRRPGEVIGDYIVREQRAFREMTEALRRVRNSRSEKSGVRRHDHRATSVNSSVCSDAEYEMVEDEDAFVEAPWRQEQTGQTFFELEIRGYRLLQNARLSREERQMVLAGTRNDTEYTAIVTQLRSAWDDQDLRERDRGGKSFGKGRTVHFAEADTEWYAEQIAHSISGDASELEVTWSFDPVEAIWWCGVLDPSIPAPDVMDWSEDWSYSESSPCAEDVFPEQSQVLALTSDDASSPECVQQAEVLVAEANRTLAQARSAVASAKQNRSGFFPPSNVSSSRKGKGKGKVKGKSKDSSCLICGRSDHFWRQCPERHSKRSGKGGKNGSRTFYLGAAWGLDSELFETVVLQADVVLDCGATETAGGVEAVQILVDAVKQGFSDSRVEVDSLDRPWFRFANGHWGRALSRVWLLTPMAWISIYTLEAETCQFLPA